MASSVKLLTVLAFALLVDVGHATHRMPCTRPHTLVALLPLTMMGLGVEASSHGPMDEGRKLAAQCRTWGAIIEQGFRDTLPPERFKICINLEPNCNEMEK